MIILLGYIFKANIVKIDYPYYFNYAIGVRNALTKGNFWVFYLNVIAGFVLVLIKYQGVSNITKEVFLKSKITIRFLKFEPNDYFLKFLHGLKCGHKQFKEKVGVILLEVSVSYTVVVLNYPMR